MDAEQAKGKGLLCSVYRSGRGDCTNDGLSSKAEDVVLLSKEKGHMVFSPSEEHPAFIVVKRELYGSTYVHAEPAERPKSGNIGWMAGGNLLFSCDSRWKELTGVSYPIQIHDREETQRDYDYLSR